MGIAYFVSYVSAFLGEREKEEYEEATERARARSVRTNDDFYDTVDEGWLRNNHFS
jgi:hypothetical protein